MEAATAVASLMWVIAILNLQRMDRHTADYLSAIKWGSAMRIDKKSDAGIVNREQLELVKGLPERAMIKYLESMIEQIPDNTKVGMYKNAVEYFSNASKIKHLYEVIAIVLSLLTIGLAAISGIEYKGGEYFLGELQLNYTILFILTVLISTSIFFEKKLSKLTDSEYPISFGLHPDHKK